MRRKKKRQMNHLIKKTASLLLIFILICICIFSTACGNTNNGSATDNNLVVSETENDPYPAPVEKTWESSDNALGARYIFDLEELCKRLQKSVKEMGVSISSFNYDDWKILSENLVDDNGVEYSTYYYSTDKLAFTAAVENRSKKVMNVGCGCSYDMFTDEEEDYQYSVLTMTSLIACTAGGYSIDDIDFMYSLIVDVTKNTSSIYFNNNIYLVKYDENENESVLFMISAISETKSKEWNLIDYRDYLMESST